MLTEAEARAKLAAPRQIRGDTTMASKRCLTIGLLALLLLGGCTAPAQGQPAAVDQLLRATLARYPGFQPAAALLLANAAEHGRRAEAEAFLASLRAGGP